VKHGLSSNIWRTEIGTSVLRDCDVSLWSPLRQTAFLGLFVAAFASNIGTWIQNVAAAWLMTSLAPNALMVGLVQTLSGLPVFYLLSLPALWLILSIGGDFCSSPKAGCLSPLPCWVG
jgi:hypothetical protein